MVAAMAATAAPAQLCCCVSSPPQVFKSMSAGLAPTQRGGAGFTAAISAGLFKPLSSLWLANSASSPSSWRWLTEEQRFPPRWALSNVAPVAPRRTHYGGGDGGRPNRMVAEVYEQNGGPPQQQQQQERGPFPRPPVILWEKDLGNAVQLMGRVGRDIEIKYLNSGKFVATTSLAVRKGSQRTEDPSWFTLEFCDDLAEIAAHHVAKGELILVAGKIVVDERVKDDVRCTIVKVVVRDLCFVEPSSDRRQRYGQSNDAFTVRGSRSQSQAEVVSTDSSQRNWNHEQLSSQPSQGAWGHGNNVAQLEAQSPQTRAGSSKWREAAKMIDQNWNPSHEVVGGIQSRQQNIDSLKVELKRVGAINANLTRSIRANDVLEIREPEPLSREEEGQSSHIPEGDVTQNSVRQDLRTEEVPRKAVWMDGRSSPPWLKGLGFRMKAGLNLTAKGRLQSRASYGSRDWSRDTAQGTGSTHMHSAGTTTEAIAGLQDRLQRRITTDLSTYIKILQMCLQQKDLLAAKQVHDCIIKSGMDKNPYVAGTLMNVYIKCGRLLDARRVFDELEKKTLIDWNSMIAAYAKNGTAESAFGLFKLMRQEGVRPNAVTYVCILKAFASPSALKWGKEVHECIQHAGFESDVRVGNALLNMYSKCGCMTEARRVFEKLTNRDVITWNIMIGAHAKSGRGMEAYGLFLQMRREGFEPDAVTYASILNASASAGALEWVKKVHGHVLKAGLESDLRVGSALVHMYAKSGSLDDARLVFDRMEKRDVITWNIMIGALAGGGRGMEAYGLFLQMRREGFEPDAVTYASILNASASASAGALEWVKKVHGHARKAGLESDLRVGNGVVHMYAKSGSIDDARLVFDRMEKRDVFTWNIMIGALAEGGRGMEAYGLFLQMRREGLEPDAVTYVSILNASASASAGALELVKKVHGHARKSGLESDFRVGSALVHMYAKSGSIDYARLLFDRMDKGDVVTWTVMIGGLAEHGRGHEALELFRKMIVDRVKPNGSSFVAVLSACSHGGLVDDGRRLFSAMTQDYGIEPDIVHYTCMVDLLGRAGYLEEAKQFISDMPVEPGVVTWRSLLGACRTYGNVELGELAAQEVFKLEPKDASAYVLLSNIYAAAGKWEKVSYVRTMMQERRVRKEPGRSWIEVDNKIHEFVVGDTSHPEAEAIYTELKKLTERLKAEGYIPDTRLVLHEINEEDKELALCSHSEKLAIAYGLMQVPWGEPIRVSKNLRVCSDCHSATKYISKVTGREIIARDANRFHHFKDGMCSCGDYW